MMPETFERLIEKLLNLLIFVLIFISQIRTITMAGHTDDGVLMSEDDDTTGQYEQGHKPSSSNVTEEKPAEKRKAWPTQKFSL